ncbi:MAG: hypothetical protein ACE5LX_02995 [Nitrospinota bacterium]
MKRFLVIALVIAGILGVWVVGSNVYAHGTGGWGSRYFTPYGGRGYWGMGPGMMGGMMGPGMMGWGRGPEHCEYAPGYRGESTAPLTKEKAAEIVERHLAYTGNPYLKLGQITDKGDYFEAELVTKKGGELAAKLWIDKRTGQLRPAS